MDPPAASEPARSRAGGGGAVAWTVAAVLTVVACVVFVAGGGAKSAGGPPVEREQASIAETPKKKEEKKSPGPSKPAAPALPKSGRTKPSELEVARARLDELAKTYLPQAPAYREQQARVQALETVEREHAGEPRELKTARVDLAVAVARGLAEAHPKVRELKARIEELEERVTSDE